MAAVWFLPPTMINPRRPPPRYMKPTSVAARYSMHALDGSEMSPKA